MAELKTYKTNIDGGRQNEGFEPEHETTDPPTVKLDITNEECNGQDEPTTGCAKHVYTVQNSIYSCFRNYSKAFIRLFVIVLLCLYFAYFAYAMYYRFGDEGSIRLLVCTVAGVILMLFVIFLNITKKQRRKMYKNKLKPAFATKTSKRALTIMSWGLKIAMFVFIIVYIVIDIALEHPRNLLAVAGLAIYVVIFFVFSVNPAKVKWHPVFWGFALQFVLAVIILRQEWGYNIFQWIGDRVSEFLKYSDAGATFLYGDGFEEHFVAFSVLSIVVFFCTFINILYYLGVMQIIIRFIGRFLAFCMGTTPAESLNAAGNIFVGMVEAPMIVSPFLKDMTKSELHAVMTGGFATIAGSVLGAYIGFGVPANHLISASVISAPAALAISKLAYPETEVSKATSKDFYKLQKTKERTVIEAASNGATKSITLVAAIAVNVLAFLSLLKFVNATLTWFGDRVGVEELTLQFICSYVFYPIPYFMGADVMDCRKIAELIGIKTFTNEFIAYRDLARIMRNGDTLDVYRSNSSGTGVWFWENDNVILNDTGRVLQGGVLSARSEVIATYALCGFSNIGSMGILLGGLGALVPSRKPDLVRLLVRSMVCGNVACFLTACIAGLLYKEH